MKCYNLFYESIGSTNILKCPGDMKHMPHTHNAGLFYCVKCGTVRVTYVFPDGTEPTEEYNNASND